MNRFQTANQIIKQQVQMSKEMGPLYVNPKPFDKNICLERGRLFD